LTRSIPATWGVRQERNVLQPRRHGQTGEEVTLKWIGRLRQRRLCLPGIHGSPGFVIAYEQSRRVALTP